MNTVFCNLQVTPPMVQIFSYISSSLSDDIANQKFAELSVKHAEDEQLDVEILNMDPIIPCRPR